MEVWTNVSTTIRPELSDKSKYWIEKHRYYELKHFCLQYPLWKRMHNSLDGMSKLPQYIVTLSKNYSIGDPVGKCVEARSFYSDRIKMIERIAKETDDSLSCYILKGITEGISYDHLRTRFDIPCCKDTYYDLYRRFFWLLSRDRQ